MEEEFQGGVCGGNWRNSRNLFTSSPCAAAVNGWLNPSLIAGMKTANSISDDSAGSTSDGGSSVVLQEAQQPQLTPNNGSMLEIMTDSWSQDFLHDSARSEPNYSHILQLQALNSNRQNIADFSADSSANSFRQGAYQSFVLDQQPPNSFSTSLPTSFPFNMASCGYASSLLQTLFDADSQPQQALLDPDFRMNSSGVVVAPMMKASIQKPNNSQFINNTAFWNATAPPSSGDVRASFLPSSTPQLIPSALTKPKLNQQSFSSKPLREKASERDSKEPSFKRPRIETPSPLPTFKVRKEKLGDRVTALQQLVSPFGKTDTASVLHEAIEYIKLLHDQVAVLSTPYLKNGPPPLQRQQASNKMKDQEEPSKDLRTRGLCLVPISSTFPVATETTADFWTPTFGASFR